MSGKIGEDAASLLEKEVETFYPQEIAKKHHFVEGYLSKLKEDDLLRELFSLKPQRTSSLKKLLSSNLDDALLKAIGQENTSISHEADQI